ncbi:hypothetical protein M9H77_29677 [Catharanthus roseus]|uniref:Uncharacterized protein n=1 Tax=Catharanthus roseus TaxID=4058 RepID=A0ACB9ZWZ8_CATRO|nr:hypothetical protein M9H77_29677 [Catharanthus roseus]
MLGSVTLDMDPVDRGHSTVRGLGLRRPVPRGMQILLPSPVDLAEGYESPIILFISPSCIVFGMLLGAIRAARFLFGPRRYFPITGPKISGQYSGPGAGLVHEGDAGPIVVLAGLSQEGAVGSNGWASSGPRITDGREGSCSIDWDARAGLRTSWAAAQK